MRKAFLLSAGEGKRLRPITEDIPKCLVQIGGKPLLGIWLEILESYGFEEVLINIYHKSNLVTKYLNENYFGISVHRFYEQFLYGTAGTVKANSKFIGLEEDFLIIYCDNLTDMNLRKMIDFHYEKRPILTMGLFRSEDPSQCGVVELDRENCIVSFIEKSRKPKGNLSNAGIYVANRRLFYFLPDKLPIDFGYEVFPYLINNMYGYVIKDYFIDIGTIRNYKKAQKEWMRD